MKRGEGICIKGKERISVRLSKVQSLSKGRREKEGDGESDDRGDIKSIRKKTSRGVTQPELRLWKSALFPRKRKPETGFINQ